MHVMALIASGRLHQQADFALPRHKSCSVVRQVVGRGVRDAAILLELHCRSKSGTNSGSCADTVRVLPVLPDEMAPGVCSCVA